MEPIPFTSPVSASSRTSAQNYHRLVGVALITGMISSAVAVTLLGPSVFVASLTGGSGSLAAAHLAVVNGGRGAYITASNMTITQGGTTQLQALCSQSDSASIDQGIGRVDPVNWNYINVTPSQTTTYTLTCGSTTVTPYIITVYVTITVNPPALPDLIISNTSAMVSGDVTVAGGSSVTLPATLANQGGNLPSPPPSFNSYYWIDTNSVHTADSATWGTQSSVIAHTGTFNANSSLDVSQSWTAPIVAQTTTYYYRYCTDWNGTVTESDENNNCSSWQTITITPPTITSCTPSTTTAAPNENVTWTVATSGFSPTDYSWQVSGGSPSSQSGSQTNFTSKYSAAGSYAPTVTATQPPSATPASTVVGPFSCTPVTISGAASTCGAPTTATLTVTPARFVAGSSARIDYSVAGVTAGQSCTITGYNIGGEGINTLTTPVADSSCNITTTRSVTVTNITTQTAYTINCGSGDLKKAIANVLPHFREF